MVYLFDLAVVHGFSDRQALPPDGWKPVPHDWPRGWAQTWSMQDEVSIMCGDILCHVMGSKKARRERQESDVSECGPCVKSGRRHVFPGASRLS